MFTVRLFVDSLGAGWAVVQCPACQGVTKHPALAAFDSAIECTCGETINVRDKLMREAQSNPKAPRALMISMGGFVQHSFK